MRSASSAVSSRIAATTPAQAAARILVDFNRALPRFVKVLPVDYKRVLAEEAAKAEEARRCRVRPAHRLRRQAREEA